MAKTVPGALNTHLQGDVTAIASAWQITRTDGQVFRFTNGSRNATLDFGDGPFSFSASEGFNRSNIANDADLNVGNLEVVGLFDNAALKEDELRRGLFDFADVKIAFYNQLASGDGIIKMLRGQLSEVQVTPKGFFNVELRDLTQVYSKQLGEYYSKDCRDDLGGLRCTVPIFPALLTSATAVALGEFYRVPTSPDPSGGSRFVLNFEGADGSTAMVNEGTHTNPDAVQGNAQIDTAQAPAGGDSTSSLLLDGVGDYLQWNDNDAWHFGAGNAVTIQAHIRLNAIGKKQTIIARYNSSSNDREYFLRVSSANVLQWVTYSNGTTVDLSMTGTTALTAGVDHHVAVVRKTNGDWVVFLDGAIEVGPTTPASDMWNSGDFGYVGALESAGIGHFFDGWIDSLEILVGLARWEAPFTPPTGSIDVTPAEPIWEAFGDRIYEVTTAGTTAAGIQVPNQTVGGTHSQGSAVLTARHSFMRFAEVSAVDGSEPRRKFTVTQLTPNSGYAIGDRTPSSVGFADDFFNFGQAFFETGNNAGIGKEVRDFVADDGITIEQDVELFEALPFDVAVGDKLRIYPGCNKTHAECVAKFNNAINFVGEPFVPGADTLGTYPDARQR